MHLKRLPKLLAAAIGLAPPLLIAALSFAQAPPAVPALPDQERRTSYSLSGTTCACSVGFALYGSGSDVDQWLEVWIAGTRYLSTDSTHGWALTSATGTLATIPRPITDAVLTFTAVQTGVVQIVGAERPRRTAQFAENRGVAARDLNQALTDIIAQNRETWDKINDVTGRGFFAPPGSTGGIITSSIPGGVISSLGPFTNGNFAIWNGSSGTSLADSGVAPGNILLPTINVQTPISRATVLAAIVAGEALGGAIVQLPAGAFSVDTTAGCIPITGSIIIRGTGPSFADGTGTTLSKTNAANDLFCVTSASFGQVAFRDFGISASVAQNSNTAAIHIISVTGITPVVIENMAINNFFNGVQIDNAPQFYINNNLITSFTGNGIVIAQPNSADAGVAVISNNKIWDIAGTAGGSAGILWHSGSGLRIHNNRILGAFNYGIYIDFTNSFGSDGALLISQNMIELQKLYGVYMKRESAASTNTIGQITITGNHFQALTAGYQNVIGIESSSPSGWVQGATITGNIVQNGRDDLLNNAVIRIDDGTGITVADSTIINTGSTGGGLRAGTNSSSVLFANNNNIGASASVRYPTTQSTTTIIDPVGIPFANIPSAAKDGSQIYITDGTHANPISGSGAGAYAIRVNGAWSSVGNTAAWTAYTPTLACVAGALTTSSATGRYQQFGKTVTVELDISITTNGTCATALTATLPFNVAAKSAIGGKEVAASGIAVNGMDLTAGTAVLDIRKYDGTYPGANGTEFIIGGVYESQ